jgi:hypothetical protein
VTQEEMSEEHRQDIDPGLAKDNERSSPSRLRIALDRAASARDNALAAKERTVDSAREQLHDSIESGRAAKVGHTTIDALAKGATVGLPMLPLPPGTRRVGRSMGKRLIGRVQVAGHDRLSASLTTDSSLPVEPESTPASGAETAAHSDEAEGPSTEVPRR